MKPYQKYLILTLLIYPFISTVYFNLQFFYNYSDKVTEEKDLPLLSDVIIDGYTIPGVSSSLSSDQIIKIGVLDDLNYISGEHTVNGALLAAKETNQAGGIVVGGLNYYVGIIAENTEEANPNLDISKAVTAAQTMVNVHDPHFIIGGFRTEALLTYLEVIMDDHIPFMGTGCPTDQFCQKVYDNYARYKYFFRIMPLNTTSKAIEFLYYIDALATFLGTEFSGSVDKVAIIREDLSWTAALSTALNYYLPSFGLTVVEDIAFPLTVTATEFMSYMATIDASDAQILIPLISAQGGILMNIAYENIQPKCIIAGFDSLAELNTYWDDTSGDCKYEIIIQHTYRTNKTIATIPFWDNYVNEFGKEPFYTGIGAYDAVKLLVNAVNDSQSLNSDTIVSTLETKTLSDPFIGASGNIAFTSSHDLFEGWPYNTYLFCQWQTGGLKQVVPSYNIIYPNSIATAPLIIPYWGINNLIEALYPPGTFTLTTNAESPEIDGSFTLSWTESQGADSYSIYSSNSPISSLNQNLKLITHQYDNTSYKISNLKTGDYYFIAVSYNSSGETLSNSIYVDVLRPSPGPFTLTSDADDPDLDGIFNLSWTSSEGADNYTIYSHTEPITEINKALEIIAYQSATSPYSVIETTNGIHYYVIEAVNDTGTTLSNNIYVNISCPSPGPFTLTSDADDPDLDGIFNLFWTSSEGADNYTVYRYIAPITEINESLDIIAHQNATSPLSVIETINGGYYYIVEAVNATGTTLSNYISVEIQTFKSLTVISPNVSSSWEVNTSQLIIWTSTGSISNIKIELYRHNAFVTYIVLTTINNGEFEWLVSTGLSTSNQYKIKIVDLENSSIYAYSSYFEIVNPTSQELPIIPSYNLFLVIYSFIAISTLLTKKRFKKIIK